MSFKLEVVREIEQRELARNQAVLKCGIQAKSTIREWLRKYGNFDCENQVTMSKSKTPQQPILELEEKIKLLEKQKARAEDLANVLTRKLFYLI